MLLMAVFHSLGKAVSVEAPRVKAALLALHVAEVLSGYQAPVLLVVGAKRLSAGPTGLLAFRVDRERPHLEAAASRGRRCTAGCGRRERSRTWGRTKKFGNMNTSPPHRRMPPGGAQRDAGAGGVLVERPDGGGCEILSRRNLVADALEDMDVPFESHGVLALPQRPARVDESLGPLGRRRAAAPTVDLSSKTRVTVRKTVYFGHVPGDSPRPRP